MSCKAEVIESKQVTNELVSYRVVCCGELCSWESCSPDSHSCEDTRITLHLDADHDKKLAEYKSTVEARHHKMKQWRAKQ